MEVRRQGWSLREPHTPDFKLLACWPTYRGTGRWGKPRDQTFPHRAAREGFLQSLTALPRSHAVSTPGCVHLSAHLSAHLLWPGEDHGHQ